jgi:hypothetical protein
MSDTVLVAIIMAAGQVLGGGVVLWWLKRRDRVSQVVEKVNRSGEFQGLILETLQVVLKALREGHINGESERMEEEIRKYLTTCTSNGFVVREDGRVL